MSILQLLTSKSSFQFLLSIFKQNNDMNPKTFLKKNRFITLLLLVVFLLRLPSLFEPYWYGDEGIYLTLGLAIKRGLLLYRDVFDNKPPLIYLVAALASGTMFWFRFFLMASTLSAIFFFYRLSQKFFLDQKKPAKVATLILATLTTLRLFEGNIANAEIFILLPTILSLYLLVPNLLTGKTKFLTTKTLLVGVIFGLGFLYKTTAVFDFIALLVFLVFYQNKNKPVVFGKREIFLCLGYLLPILTVSFFFWLRGSWPIFFHSCFSGSLGYLSSWKTGSHHYSFSSLFKTDLPLKSCLVLFILFGVWLKRKGAKPQTSFLWVWFVLSLFSATLPGRPYPHYLIQTIPSLALVTGLFLTREPKKAFWIFLSFISFFLIAIVRYQFWGYTTLSYYGNFLRFILKKTDKKTYLSYFNPQMPQIYSLAEFIVNSTQEKDKIFIWADEPYLYPLSQRLPAISYVVAYHIIERSLFEKVAQKISLEKPALVVFDQNKSFPQLETFLENNYLQINSFNNLLVFKRRIF